MDPDKLYLVQTDTTVGFLSQDSSKLAQAKRRPAHKPFLIEVDSFKTLHRFARVPQRYKKVIRRSKKTTFIYPNGSAIRVVKEKLHLQFLKKFGWMYSSSANLSGATFDLAVASHLADVIVVDERGLYEGEPSRLIKINQKRRKKIR